MPTIDAIIVCSGQHVAGTPNKTQEKRGLTVCEAGLTTQIDVSALDELICLIPAVSKLGMMLHKAQPWLRRSAPTEFSPIEGAVMRWFKF